MALSGVHVACGYSGGPQASFNPNSVRLFGPVVWSQTMATGTTTSNSAPGNGIPVFEIYSSADVYVSIGPSPDATNGPRVLVPAATTVNYICEPGDKLAWIAA